MAGSGVKFAWIKATEGGDHVDERFQANWQGAKLAGIPPRRLSLHVLVPEADRGSDLVRGERAGRGDALPPVLDVEPTPDSRTCRRHLEPDQTIADMKVVLDEMERHFGKRPIIYTSIEFYNAILAGGAFADYPIWVRSTKHNPAMRYGDRDWKFWQYQADGIVPGIDGEVDRNVFYGDRDQWQAFLDGPKQARDAQLVNSSPGAEPTPAANPPSQATLAPPMTIEPSRQAGD